MSDGHSCFCLRDGGGEVVDVVIETDDAGPFSLTETVSAMVGGADGDTVGDQPLGDPRVAAAVLGKPVRDDDDPPRLTGGKPRLMMDTQAADADEIAVTQADDSISLFLSHTREPSRSRAASTTPKLALPR